MEHAIDRGRQPGAAEEGSRPLYGTEIQGDRGRRSQVGSREGLDGISHNYPSSDQGLEGRSRRVAQGVDCYCLDLGYRNGHIPSCSASIGGEILMKKVRTTLIIVAIIFSVGASTAAGIIAVVSGIDRNQQVCDAVNGVRDDLVTALKRIETRALEQAKTPKQRALVLEGYEGKKKGQEGLITQIGDPTCP